MLDEYGKPIDVPDRLYTPHELGQIGDYSVGLQPMALAPPTERAPPPFPLAAYLVMKRAE